MYAIITPYSLCEHIEQQITERCLADNKWTDGITRRYGHIKHPDGQKGAIEIINGYGAYFAPFSDKFYVVKSLSSDWFSELELL